MSKKLIEIPDEPIDGYVIRYWRFTLRSLYEETATYYVHTKWSDYCEDEERSHGMDLIDDWMVTEFGHVSGRITGWFNAFKSFQGQADRGEIFLSKPDAVDHATGVLRDRIERLKTDQREAQDSLDSLEN